MLNDLNIGDNLTLPNGMSGTIWGKRTTEAGDFVQFSADGEWHRYEAPAPEAKPAEAPADAPAAQK